MLPGFRAGWNLRTYQLKKGSLGHQHSDCLWKRSGNLFHQKLLFHFKTRAPKKEESGIHWRLFCSGPANKSPPYGIPHFLMEVSAHPKHSVTFLPATVWKALKWVLILHCFSVGFSSDVPSWQLGTYLPLFYTCGRALEVPPPLFQSRPCVN